MATDDIKYLIDKRKCDECYKEVETAYITDAGHLCLDCYFNLIAMRY
jgi:hypothetical protein